jgi:hypothetical protein
LRSWRRENRRSWNRVFMAGLRGKDGATQKGRAIRLPKGIGCNLMEKSDILDLRGAWEPDWVSSFTAGCPLANRDGGVSGLLETGEPGHRSLRDERPQAGRREVRLPPGADCGSDRGQLANSRAAGAFTIWKCNPKRLRRSFLPKT